MFLRPVGTVAPPDLGSVAGQAVWDLVLVGEPRGAEDLVVRRSGIHPQTLVILVELARTAVSTWYGEQEADIVAIRNRAPRR